MSLLEIEYPTEEERIRADLEAELRPRETEAERRLRESEAGVDYWKKGDGVDKRSELFAALIVTVLSGAVVAEVARANQIREIEWLSHPEMSMTGSCAYCAGQTGARYNPALYYPPVRPHPNCNCEYIPVVVEQL